MIEIRNLNYEINNKIILQNINLTIQKGEFAAIIGPNGAGKSTLIKIILGVIKNYKGEVLIEGLNHKTWLSENIIGYVPQREIFDRNFPSTVEELILMGLAGKRGIFKRFSKEDKQNAFKVAKMVGVENLLNQNIGTLSGGQFQRVLLARALITDSDYLILDEPEAGVDKEGIESFYKLLVKLYEQGKTIILVSHDINIITKYCNYLICLNKTLHCHTQSELVSAEVLKKTYGDVIQIIEKKYD
jgi:zinc transport system ATP-binding protein